MARYYHVCAVRFWRILFGVFHRLHCFTLCFWAINHAGAHVADMAMEDDKQVSR